MWEAWLCRLAEEEGEETQPRVRQGYACPVDMWGNLLEAAKEASTLGPLGRSLALATFLSRTQEQGKGLELAVEAEGLAARLQLGHVLRSPLDP